MQHVIKRGKWFYFFRRIPVMYACFYDGQRFIKVALKTDSAKVANQRAQLLNSELEKIWSHMAQHGDIDKDTMFDNAVFQSRNNLFTHQSVNEISQKNIGELVSRVLYVGDSPNKGNIEATLGRVEKLPYPISKAINDFFEFERPNLLDKNDHQLSKWKNPRLKAINTFIDVVEDKDVTAIRREDMLDYREWWHRRIVAEGLTANSANKAFSYIKQVLAYVRDDKRLEIDLGRLFDRIRFAEKKVRGVPFKTSYILETLLNDNNLQGLNEECRLFLYAMADTGARNSEIVGLNAGNGDIRLDADIPFIHIRPHEGNRLKTSQSERQIPLVGAALYAFKHLPQGFRHYYCKADLLSSTINKYLRENNLLPTSKHSVYSLRHSFDDRLLNASVPEKIIAALMGHKYKGHENYGKGASLELKKQHMEKICFNIQ